MVGEYIAENKKSTSMFFASILFQKPYRSVYTLTTKSTTNICRTVQLYPLETYLPNNIAHPIPPRCPAAARNVVKKPEKESLFTLSPLPLFVRERERPRGPRQTARTPEPTRPEHIYSRVPHFRSTPCLSPTLRLT